jgi:exodeoxyribonuclease III
MRIITLNCNGIRSAARKGLFDWLPQQQADILCLQETKAQEHQLDHGDFRPPAGIATTLTPRRKATAGWRCFPAPRPTG